MTKTKHNLRLKKGLTLIEIMLAILVMAVVVIGTSGYRYYSALDARRAQKEAVAAKIGLLLNESWRGVYGSTAYDPVTQLSGTGLNLQTSGGAGLAGPTGSGWQTLGSYQITLDNATYFITLAYNPAMATDPWNATHKRKGLTTIVAWPITTNETNYSTTNYSNLVFTTYVEVGM